MDKLLTAVAHPLAPGPNPLHAAAHYAALPLHFAHSLCPYTSWPFFLLMYLSIILFLRHKPEFLPLNLKPWGGKPQVSYGEAWESPYPLTPKPSRPILAHIPVFLYHPTTLSPSFIAQWVHIITKNIPTFHSISPPFLLRHCCTLHLPHPAPVPARPGHVPPSCPALPCHCPTCIPLGLPLAASLTLMLSSHLLRSGRGSLGWGTSGEGLRGSPAFSLLMEGSAAGLLTCPSRW